MLFCFRMCTHLYITSCWSYILSTLFTYSTVCASPFDFTQTSFVSCASFCRSGDLIVCGFASWRGLRVKQNSKNKPSLRSESTRTFSFPSPLPTRKITTVGEPFCQLQECATSSRSLPIFQKATKPSHSQRENNNEHFLVLLHAEGVIARQLLQHLLEALVYPLTAAKMSYPSSFASSPQRDLPNSP